MRRQQLQKRDEKEEDKVARAASSWEWPTAVAEVSSAGLSDRMGMTEGPEEVAAPAPVLEEAADRTASREGWSASASGSGELGRSLRHI